jgi:CheY-like chemotaxis protein
MPLQVLVIDDDALSREVFVLLLEAAGYTGESAGSGEAALSLLQSASQLPGAILADLQMPGITGNDLAKRLRPLCGPAATLFAMSATPPENGSVRDYDGFLLKPFTIEVFTAALARADRDATNGSHAQESSILDETIYRKLAGSMRPPQLQQLYTLCLADIDARLTKMQSSASNGDDKTYRAEAHAIKGSCGMVGATELQSLATSMEKQGLSDDHVASLKEILLAAKRLQRMLRAREISHSQDIGDSGEDAR